jgi:sec-independent protein translocase protein TatC
MLNHDYASYIPHLIELRARLIRCCLVVLFLFLILFYIDDFLYTYIAGPFIERLPKSSALIATEVTTPFTVPMKLALVVSLLLSIPYLLFQLWSFIAPGLYRHEKKAIIPMILMSVGLFYMGVIFAYWVICPLALQFFALSAPPGILILTDIRHYLDFVLTIFFAGGIAFQVPIVTFAVFKAGMVTALQLSHIRPYVIVAAFIIGMLLTPPDVVSQILLAVPMCALYEMGVLYIKYIEKQKLIGPSHSR